MPRCVGTKTSLKIDFVGDIIVQQVIFRKQQYFHVGSMTMGIVPRTLELMVV